MITPGATVPAIKLAGKDDFDRRLGLFRVSRDLVTQAPATVAAALSGMVILRAEMIFHHNAIEYIAMSRSFAKVPEGQEPPEYRCEFRKDGATVTHTWRRA
jgi:hypothetical protein